MDIKKSLWSLPTILMVAMLSIGFVSCGDDEDDDIIDSGITSNSLIGTWSRNYTTADGINATEVYTFSKNGSGTYKNAYQTATFTYVAVSGYISVKIRYNDSSNTIEDVWSYSISGRTIIINGNQYTKQ